MINYNVDSPGDNGGDKTEKEAWPLFAEEKFPNYELLWQRFVVPRTGRPNNIHFSQGIPLEDKEIAGIHYSILHGFYVVYKWLSEKEANGATEKESFEYSFVKLSNICDLTEEMLFKLLILTGQLDSNSPQIVKAVDQDSKDEKIAKINAMTAGMVLDDLRKRGTSSVTLLDRVRIIDDKFDLKRYKSLSGEIRRYRNVIVHSWHSFQINNMVPKADYIKGYQDWARVTDVIKSNDDTAKQALLKDFVPMRELVQQQVDKLVTVVNQLWSEIIPLIPPHAGALPTPNNSSTQQLLHAGGSIPYATASGTMIDHSFRTTP